MGPEVACGALVPPTPRNSQMLPSSYSYQLAQRTFHTFDFYKKHQDAMTPAGLAFFQCRWDDSVTHIFHQLLGKGRVGKGEGAAGLSAQTSPDMPGVPVRGGPPAGVPFPVGWLGSPPEQADRQTGSGQQQSTPGPLLHSPADMREPVFEFVRPPPYHPKQKSFPHRQPLRYLDRYRVCQEPTYGIY